MEHIQFKDLASREDIKLGGSTGAQVVSYKDRLYVYKTGLSVQHAVNEYIAFKLYKLADVRVPDVFLAYANKEVKGILIEYIDGEIPMKIRGRSAEENELVKTTIQKDYVVHALFANWDAKNYENYIIAKRPDGSYDYTKLYVIDLGGALFYRAQGEAKGTAFTTKTVPNIHTLAEFSGKSRAKYFADLMDTDTKFAMVCDRWKTINRTRILDFLQSPSIASLLVAYSMSALHSIIAGRIHAINVWCSGANKPKKAMKAVKAAKAVKAVKAKSKKVKGNAYPIPRRPKTYKKRWVTSRPPDS